ncbi:hypothetical protein PIROE2DRAFT_9154 [Piromyces sp. E2]|nr:hypothetical protein PIROE2DRAFT_9154 [Piromyces sp. E2]|eukprot:OUM64186.1 hypothetical protein PIROE2DRAFT_9154 [Piromyces sp. E2]
MNEDKFKHYIYFNIFSGNYSTPIVNLSDEEESTLYKRLSICVRKFQYASCNVVDDVVETLIPEYKHIYTNDDIIGNILIEAQEDLVYKDIKNLVEAGDKILLERKGLPEAALKLCHMYEIIGVYNVSLVWAYVSYKLGFVQSKNDAQNLLCHIKVL